MATHFLNRSNNSDQSLNKIPNLKQFIVSIGTLGQASINNLNVINEAMGSPDDHLIQGVDGDALRNAMNEIAKDMVDNIWSFSGPIPVDPN